jgi:hypothetical protein
MAGYGPTINIRTFEQRLIDNIARVPSDSLAKNSAHMPYLVQGGTDYFLFLFVSCLAMDFLLAAPASLSCSLACLMVSLVASLAVDFVKASLGTRRLVPP